MSLSLFESGMQRFDEIIQPGVLCAFDFDGTLSPIVKDPERACIPAAVLRRLSVLTEHALVAIISGRSVIDVSARLDFSPHFVVGNHGIEGIPGGEDRSAGYRKLCRDWAQRLTAALQDRNVFEPDIWVEQKDYSLSVHYRLARDRANAETVLLQLFKNEVPEAHIMAGKCVFNVLPPGAPHKGMALAKLCEVSGAHTAIYVGDDVTDEDVFQMHRPNWLTVRVERSTNSAADYYLHHRLDMVHLLDALIKRLGDARPVV